MHIQDSLSLLPPFTLESATRKVRLVEDAWNSRDPEQVLPLYTTDTLWRERTKFMSGHQEVYAFLQSKWVEELEYRLVKEIWGTRENRMAVRFAYEWHDNYGRWYRSYGIETWEFNALGLIQKQYASINDLPILPSQRMFLWSPLGRRPEKHPELSRLSV